MESSTNSSHSFPTDLSQLKIAFAGCGAMAQALIDGFILSKNVKASHMCASDISSTSKTFCEQRSITFYNSTLDMFSNEQFDVLLLCIKPDQLRSVLCHATSIQKKNCMIISICAGVSLTQIRNIVSPHEDILEEMRIARVMPNVNCTVQASAMGYVLEKPVVEDAELVESLLKPCGLIFRLEKEEMMHAVTGLSGSGPAFVFQFIEALADGGVRSGLPRHIALELAAQTVFGSAKMVLETKKHPAVLKDMVTSPGGTTIAGVHALESGGVRAAVIDAVYQATNRSKELGNQK